MKYIGLFLWMIILIVLFGGFDVLIFIGVIVILAVIFALFIEYHKNDKSM